MEHLIALLQSSQDRDGILHAGLIHHDRLETPLQGSVLLNILTVLVKSRCADTVQLSSRKHRFQHISRIHGTVCLAGPDDGVELINKEDDPAFTVLHFLKDSFQTFLKLAPVFCTGNKRSHIKGEDRLLFQPFRHIAADDPLGQAFYDCGLTYTGFTDEDRVVLCLTGEDTDHIPDLLITPDDRIQLLLSCPLHQVLTIFVQCVISRFRIVAGHSLISSDRRKSLEESLPADAKLTEDLFHIPACIF